MMKSDLFPTTELKDLTLAQLLLEHENDWIEYHGLQKGGFWTARHLGLEHAKNIARQKISLFFSPQTLDQRLGQEAAELAENETEIRDRADAWKSDGYRGRNLVENVKQRLDLLDTDITDEDLEKASKFIDDHHRAVQEQLESSGELARQRQEALDKKHPAPSFGRAAGTVKNYLINKRRMVVPAVLGITLGASGSGIAYKYFAYQDRNRPTAEVEQVFTTDEHPGVKAAIAVTDIVRDGNQFFTQCRYGPGYNHNLAENKRLLAKVSKAKADVEEARTYYGRADTNLNLLAAGTDRIWQAWNHSKRESGHYDTVCTTSTDTNGNSHTSCHQEYRCDYVDHTWTFNSGAAASGVEVYNHGLVDLGKVSPKFIDVAKMKKQIGVFLSHDEGYVSLPPEEQEKQTQLYSDVLTSITIAGSNKLGALLSGTNGSTFRFIKHNHPNNLVFSSRTEERNWACSSRGNPPQAYVVSESLVEETNTLAEHYNDLIKRLGNTSGQLDQYQQTLLRITSTSNVDEREKEIDQVGDHTITLQDEMNPDSEYSMFTSGWRTAIPFMLLFGLGGLGIGAGYAGVSAYDRRRKQRKFLKEYGAY